MLVASVSFYIEHNLYYISHSNATSMISYFYMTFNTIRLFHSFLLKLICILGSWYIAFTFYVIVILFLAVFFCQLHTVFTVAKQKHIFADIKNSSHCSKFSIKINHSFMDNFSICIVIFAFLHHKNRFLRIIFLPIK